MDHVFLLLCMSANLWLDPISDSFGHSLYCWVWNHTVAVVVQSLSCVWLFVTTWTAACQASLSFTDSQNLLILMSIELMIPSNHLVLSLFSFYPQSFPESDSFLMSQPFLSGGQSIGASASVVSMNIQGWSPLELTGLISSLSKGLSSIFSRFSIISISPGALRDRVGGLEILIG